jgi:hypothetical protein
VLLSVIFFGIVTLHILEPVAIVTSELDQEGCSGRGLQPRVHSERRAWTRCKSSAL